MSTFLEGVQELHIDVGANGEPPTSVTGQRGTPRQLVNWYRRADFLVQTLWVNWKFLSKAYQQSTVPGVNTLAKPTDLNVWDFDTFLIDGDEQLEAVEFENVKREIFDADQAKPSRVIVLNNNDISFDPVPDDVYSITADYFVIPTRLENNGDISKIPDQFQQAVLGRAMIFFGNSENSGELVDQGMQLYEEGVARLENHQLPNLQNARFRNSETNIEVIAG